MTFWASFRGGLEKAHPASLLFYMLDFSLIFFRSSASQTADAATNQGGLVTVYKRPNRSQWQCRFKLPNGSWHSASTAKDDLEPAKQAAIAVYEQIMAQIGQELSLKILVIYRN